MNSLAMYGKINQYTHALSPLYEHFAFRTYRSSKKRKEKKNKEEREKISCISPAAVCIGRNSDDINANSTMKNINKLF